MFSQPYRSLIESQNDCLDNSNPNSVIGSTVNQYETSVRVDISTRRFSLSFSSIVNLSMTFLYFSSIVFCFISVLCFSGLSSIISYVVSLMWFLLEFINSISAVSWNTGMTIHCAWLVEKLALFPYRCVCSILLQLRLTCFKLIFLEVTVSGKCDVMFRMVLRK